MTRIGLKKGVGPLKCKLSFFVRIFRTKFVRIDRKNAVANIQLKYVFFILKLFNIIDCLCFIFDTW